MKRSIVAIAILLAASRTPAHADKRDDPRIASEKITLPNGLQVILHVDRTLPVVHVNQWFHVGSKNEKPGRSGFAHLFEHLMFQGSKNAKGPYFETAERAGANLREGGVNGTTDYDRTNYFVTAPPASLETLLWLESDRLATLVDVIDQKTLDTERDVVKNERRQGLENQPYGRAWTLILENLFPPGHFYARDVIGSHQDLSAATLEDVKEFFRTYYTPNNLSLVIAGDFDPAEAKRLVTKYFGSIPAGAPLDRSRRHLAVLEGERIVEASDRVAHERSYMVWPAPPAFDEDEAALDTAAMLLADGLSSRLQKRLIYDRQLCTEVRAWDTGLESAGFFVVMATARPGVALPDVERVVSEEIGRLAKQGPTAAELERVKNKHEAGFVLGLERLGGFGGKADRLNMYNSYLGDPDKMGWDLARYRGVTRERVRRAAARWLDTRNRLLVRFRPEPSTRTAVAAVDRTVAPPLGADPAFKVPEVRQARLDNGLAIFVVERPELPEVTVGFATRAGSIADPPGKSGLAQLTAQSLDRGAGGRTALQIEEALGDLGVRLDGEAELESASLAMQVLRRHLAPAMAILADVVLRPAFPAAEVERERKLLGDALAQKAKDPWRLSGRVGAMLAYGREHPYGRPIDGLPQSVASLGRDDVARFHADRFKPGTSALIFVGAITLDEAVAQARTSFGGWAAGSAPEVAIPAPRPAAGGRIFIVDRQDAAQSMVTQLLPAPSRRTADYDALRLADAVWGGGGFGTRLNLDLREEKGYSYGVYSILGMQRGAGVWWAGGGVQTNKTKESVVEFARQLEAIAGAQPISSAELAAARALRVRGYAQAFGSHFRIADQVHRLWELGLPVTELQRELDAAGAVSLGDVRAAATKYARPDQAVLLIVGDREKIEPGLRELDLGPIVHLDEEGRETEAAKSASR